MCHKNYGNERLTDTGYFTAGDDVFHICVECSQKIKDLINNYDMIYVGR